MGKDLMDPLLSHSGNERKKLVKCATRNGKDWNCGGAPCTWAENDAFERTKDMKKLSRAVTFCVLFMFVEVYGGIRAGSLAILTDAAHLLSDVASFAISLFAIWAGGWEANLRQTFGFYRLEILGALVSIQIIWLITGIIVYEAFVRLLHDQDPVDGRLMFIIASLGLLVNVAMMLLLDHGHSHGHGQSNGHGHGHSHGSDQDHSHHDAEEHSTGAHHHHYDSHGSVGLNHHHEKHDHDHEDHDHDHEHEHSEHQHHHEKHLTQSNSSSGRIRQAEKALQDEGHKTECVQENITQGRRSKTEDTIIVCICDEIGGQTSGNPGTGERSVRVTVDHEGLSDGHNHSKGRSINVQGAYLHVLGDLIQSIGVMIAGAVIWYNPAAKIVDLVCTFTFSFIVLGTTIKLLRDILEVLMESTPREIDAWALQNGLVEIHGVIAVHELHIWAITVGKVLLACHVTIEPDADADDVLEEVMQYCDKKFKISHVTIQIERSKE